MPEGEGSTLAVTDREFGPEPQGLRAFYEREGWALIPLRLDKRPLIVTGPEHCNASCDPAQIERWQRELRPKAWGARMGDRYFVADLDPRHGGDKTWNELQREYGPMEAAVVSRTGGGGRHLFWQMIPGLASGSSVLGRGVDIRARGSYAVVPPSLHLSGGEYVYEDNHDPREHEITPAPRQLQALLLQASLRRKQAAPPKEWRALVSEPCLEGRRNTEAARLTGYLLARDVDPYVVEGLVGSWSTAHCIPPLSPREISTIVNSICAREFRRRGS
jgi:hypothetical protein